MNVLLLLAGRSTRFWPLTEKTLFRLCGKTVLEHQIDTLKKAGLHDITLVGGAHNLEEARRVAPGLDVIEQENLDLGMQGALLSSLPHCGTDPVLIVSGNDIVEPSAYTSVVEALSKTIDCAILGYTVQRYFPGGYLQVEKNRIVSIVEKPGAGNEPSALVNIVVHAHRNASVLLHELERTRSSRDDAYEQALASLMLTTYFRAVPYTGYWQPVKYPWHLITLLEYFLSSIDASFIHPSATVHPSAVLQGNVYIAAGAKILPHATVVGPCVIGERSVVGTGALVRGSSIGADCVVGYNTEVKASILGDHVWTHSTYIGESVIGNNVSFGAGCITGNLRLDEGEITSVCKEEQIPTGLTKLGMIVGNDCRFGIAVHSNPGVKIGSGTFVVGRSFLSHDIPSDSFVREKEGKIQVHANRQRTSQPEARNKFKNAVK